MSSYKEAGVDCGIGMMLVIPEGKMKDIQGEYVYLGQLEEK